MTETTENLTTKQQAQITGLCLEAAEHTGQHLNAAGYPQPTEAEAIEMGKLWLRAFTAFVVGLGDHSPTDDELEALITGVVQGTVLRVIGLPPSAVLH